MADLTELEHLESDVVIFISFIASEKINIEDMEKELLDSKFKLERMKYDLSDKRDRSKIIKD